MALPKATTVSHQKAVVIVPFWLIARNSQQPKEVAVAREDGVVAGHGVEDGQPETVAAASQAGVVASDGVEDGHLIYKTAQFDIQSPSALVRGEQRVKSKVRMRIPYLTNDKSLVKGARLLVKGDLPAELDDLT